MPKTSSAFLRKRVCIFGFAACFFLIAATTLPAKGTGKNPFEEKILGTWFIEYDDKDIKGVQIVTFSSDKTCHFKSFFIISDTKSPSEVDQKYEIDENRIRYQVTRVEGIWPFKVGNYIYESIDKITDTEFIFRDVKGKKRIRQKVSEFQAWYLWITHTLFK
ncbi:MAG TPA: hypothetical protein PLO78_00395 [Candidatus Omnitrophota bacterium]|nr:hypothetical protein [Candidatus Omnitrophota bacterium]